MNIKVKGYILGSIAAATYGMNPLFALPLYQDGMDIASVLFFRYAIAIPIVGIMLKARGRNFKISRREGWLLLGMGLLMAISSLTLFTSYTYMEAGIASTLLFVYPVMVALIMALLFHEKISMTTVFCIGIALCGIALLYKGEDGATLSLTGTIMVLASALSYAIYIVGINQTALKDVATLKVTFYVLTVGMVAFLIWLRGGKALTLPSQWYHWFNVLALAVFPTTISFICTTRAIQYIGSTPTAILGALEPATAVFFGILIFGETLTLRESIGLALIIAAVTLIILGGKVSHLLLGFRKLFPRLSKKDNKKGGDKSQSVS